MFYKLLSATLVFTTLAAAVEPIEGVWRRGGLRWDIKHSGKQLEVKVTAVGGSAYSYTAAPDGKEYPVVGFIPGTTVKLVNMSERGFETIMLRNGKEFTHTKNTLAPDGKLLNSETFSNGSSTRMIFAHY